MKTEYISLTTAIVIFEENKIDHVRNSIIKRIKDDNDNRKKMRVYANEKEYNRLKPIHDAEYGVILSEKDLKQTTDFIFHIGNAKIPLYGKKEYDTQYEKIPNEILSNTDIGKSLKNDNHKWELKCTNKLIRMIRGWLFNDNNKMIKAKLSYIICNNYGYRLPYNHSTNYDVLKNESTEEIEYINISIKSDEFKEFMKSIRKE